jgi:hypothetical protein
MFLKALLAGLLIACGEVVNGNVRVRVLHSRVGKRRAKHISLVTGIAIITAICWVALPWIAPADYRDCLSVGALWLVIMLCLDIYFARYVFRLNWQKIVDDFNPVKGNLLGLGMVYLLFCPALVFTLRSLP